MASDDQPEKIITLDDIEVDPSLYWDPRNPVGRSLYAARDAARAKVANPAMYKNSRKGLYSGNQYTQEDVKDYESLMDVTIFNNDVNYLPDIDMSRRLQIADTVEASFKNNEFDWNDFLKFAEAERPGEGALTFWGQPLGHEAFLESPTYLALNITLGVASLATALTTDLILTGLQLLYESQVEEAAKKIAEGLKQVSEDEKALMFMRYFMWKAEGWWNQGAKTTKFYDFKKQTIEKAKTDFVGLVKDMQSAKLAWKQGLKDYQDSVTYLEQRLKMIEQMQKWADKNRPLYDIIQDPYEGRQDLLDYNQRYFQEVVEEDITNEKVSLQSDLNTAKTDKSTVDSALSSLNAAAVASWKKMSAGLPGFFQYLESERQTKYAGGYYEQRQIWTGTSYYKWYEWVPSTGGYTHSNPVFAKSLKAINELEAQAVNTGRYDSNRAKEVQAQLDKLLSQFNIPSIPWYAFRSNKYKETMSLLRAVAENGRHNMFEVDKKDPPAWYKQLDPDWIVYTRNKELYDNSVALRDEWMANYQGATDSYGQELVAPDVNAVPVKPNMDNINTSLAATRNSNITEPSSFQDAVAPADQNQATGELAFALPTSSTTYDQDFDYENNQRPSNTPTLGAPNTTITDSTAGVTATPVITSTTTISATPGSTEPSMV